MASSSCVLIQTSRLTAPERVITELTQGREIADRLRFILRQVEFDGPANLVVSAQSLLTQILDTFSHSLSMLRGGAGSDEVSEVPSGNIYKTPKAKDRRGCYKRKRSSDISIKDSPTLVEDGYAWRKYGQKAILNAKHRRHYFRCTHKFDQRCLASKQVQKIQDNPPLFRTSYIGHHTCTNLVKSAHHIIIDATLPDSTILWNFDGRQCGTKPSNTTLLADSIKKEKDVQTKSLELGQAEYYMLPELIDFCGSTHDHLGEFSSGSDCGDVLSSDVYSCTTSTRGLDDMDTMVASIEDFFELGNLS